MDYELTVVLPGTTTPAKKKAVSASLEKTVKAFKGSVKKFTEWGKLDLAYTIKKNNTGVFLYFDLELEPDRAKDLKDKLRLETDIIRFLMVRKERS